MVATMNKRHSQAFVSVEAGSTTISVLCCKCHGKHSHTIPEIKILRSDFWINLEYFYIFESFQQFFNKINLFNIFFVIFFAISILAFSQPLFRVFFIFFWILMHFYTRQIVGVVTLHVAGDRLRFGHIKVDPAGPLQVLQCVESVQELVDFYHFLAASSFTLFRCHFTQFFVAFIRKTHVDSHFSSDITLFC